MYNEQHGARGLSVGKTGMSQDQIAQFLQQGIAAARSNRPDIARGIFQQVVSLDPRNEVAWAWLASIARDNRERLIFLKQLWEINPQNEFALKGLRALGVEPGPPPGSASPAPASTVPLLDEARLAKVQQAADEFLRRYVPKPADRLPITWQKRQRGRYGEHGARRVRQLAYAGATVISVALVALIVWIATQVTFPGTNDQGGRGVASRYATETPIPSLTPTLGGPTATPIPANQLAFAPTQMPSGLKAGSAYGISSPTPMYPRPDPSVERAVENALGHFTIGQYTQAVSILSAERERSLPDCYPSLVYYEALSLAYRGDLDAAYEVLEWARSYVPPRPYKSCQDSALILAGLAEVFYLQEPDSTAAYDFSTQALARDRRLIAAVLIKGRVQLAQGKIAEAWQTVTQALEEWPEDTNLLLLAAQIELANGQTLTALDYIGRALYIDPDLLPALYLQAEAYLILAEQSTDAERRLQAYGFAVQSAQLIQRYYEGDPLGYLYKAKAYLGEGKAEEAETALTRILAVEDRLPESADAVIAEAFRLRGELYYDQGRFDRAVRDLETFIRRGGASDTAMIEKLVQSALQSGQLIKAQEWIGRLVVLQPANRLYQLWQLRLQVELCTFNPAELECNYSQALSTITDPFIASLPEASQQADAYSYRAQARLRTVAQRGAALSQSQRDTEVQLALADVDRALAIRDAAVDHYYRGLALQWLGQPLGAFEEYQWIDYWHGWYAYPFVNADFSSQFRAVSGAADEQMAQAVIALQPTPTPALTLSSPASPTAVATTPASAPSPTPTATPPPQPTATPVPVPTRIAPDVIP